MPRPKGSKNKAKVHDADLSAVIAEKTAEKNRLEEEIRELKEKAAALKALEKEIARLEKQQAQYDAARAAEEQKAALDNKIKELMDAGMSAMEILEKLK